MFSWLKNKNKDKDDEHLPYSVSYNTNNYDSPLISYYDTNNDNNDDGEYDEEYLTNKEIMEAVELYFETYVEARYPNITLVKDENLIRKFYNYLKDISLGTSLGDLSLNKYTIYLDMDDNEEEEYYDKSDLPSRNNIINTARNIAKKESYDFDCDEQDCDSCPCSSYCDEEPIDLLDNLIALIVLIRNNDTGLIKPMIFFPDEDDREFSIEYFFINEFRLFSEKNS